MRGLVVGGAPVPLATYPFTVTIMQEDPGTGVLSLLGAGVVLTPSTVLTTAVHLIRVQNTVLRALWVQYGPGVMSPNTSTSAIPVATYEVHPQFVIATRAFAACILHLSRPIDAPAFAALAPGRLVLNTDAAVEATGTGIVVGWGVTTRSNGGASPELNSVGVPGLCVQHVQPVQCVQCVAACAVRAARMMACCSPSPNRGLVCTRAGCPPHRGHRPLPNPVQPGDPL